MVVTEEWSECRRGDSVHGHLSRSLIVDGQREVREWLEGGCGVKEGIFLKMKLEHF